MGTVTADKGCDDGADHELMRVNGLDSVIRLPAHRMQKKYKGKQVWLALQARPEDPQKVKERYKIDRKFWEAKRGHGLRRFRYMGLVRYAMQAFLTAMALNLTRMVKVCPTG